MIRFKNRRLGRLGLATTAGLLVAVLQGGSADAASVTTNFVWNGTDYKSKPMQINGVFTYDDTKLKATILPNNFDTDTTDYTSTADGFRNLLLPVFWLTVFPLPASTTR